MVHNEELKEKAHGLVNVGIVVHPSALKGSGETLAAVREPGPDRGVCPMGRKL